MRCRIQFQIAEQNNSKINTKKKIVRRDKHGKRINFEFTFVSVVCLKNIVVEIGRYQYKKKN